MKNWDLPLLNQSRETPKLLSTGLLAEEAKSVLKNCSDLQARFRIAELRKSCGVEPQLSTVNVRRPHRYSQEQ